MTIKAPEIAPDEIKKLFPGSRDIIADDVFEIGLALSGTVSAGAFTGGVLDYLMEALDAWRQAIAAGDKTVPCHKIVISVIGGASGGGINALVTAKAGGLSFSHGSKDGNPFYDTWAGANAVTFRDLFSTDPDSPQNLSRTPYGLFSLFNTNKLSNLADKQCLNPTAASEKSTSPIKRDYFADPMRVIVTVTNVPGTVYDLKFENSKAGIGYSVRAHDDQIRFAVSGSGGPTRPDEFERSDETKLHMDPEQTNGWDVAAATALATSAFPFVLGARTITNIPGPAVRPVIIPAVEKSKDAEIGIMQPRTTATRSPIYVDGGVCNNDPIKAVHQELSGYLSHNPRTPQEARRALIMIDPFADLAQDNLPPETMQALLGGIVGTLKDQSRLSTADLTLATAEDCFSRFLIAPLTTSGEQNGSSLLASAAGDAFGGFASVDRLRHDYALGRSTAYNFLSTMFVVPTDNAVIAGTLTPEVDMQAHSFLDEGKTWVRLIPLMPALQAKPPKEPVRPVAIESREIDEDAFKARAGQLLDRLSQTILADRFAGTIASLAFRWPLKQQLKQYILAKAANAFVGYLTGKKQ